MNEQAEEKKTEDTKDAKDSRKRLWLKYKSRVVCHTYVYVKY